ncbi:YbbR-like domain-containing protein [Pseudodesulfovibrio sp.]|uniref:CdaR family protein n=1 Tax=unclassified Pseudodesulfovibrio TaxID=2661612 RepID=UPI003B00CE14
MVKNWQTVLLAVAMAVFTWFLVTGREVVETWVDMPVVMTNPPEGMIIEEGLVDKIQVRLRGPKGLVGNLANQPLTYSLDVSHLRLGNQVMEIDADKLPLPPTYEIIEVKPNRLKLFVDRRTTKTVPLSPAWAGKLNPDYKLLDVVASPDTVEIRGPETRIGKINQVSVVLKEDFPDDAPKSFVADVPVGVPDEIEASPGQVRVEAFFGPKTREIWVKMPLELVVPDDFNVSVSQDYVRLLIDGPVALFRNNEYRKDMRVKLVLGSHVTPGTFELDYDAILPDGCRIVKKNPETITTVLKKK